jgi:hypothetical protein
MKHHQGAPQQGERVVNALRMRAKDPNPAVARRRVLPDIGEIKIESDEYSILGAAGVEDDGIRVAAETLFKNRLYIVTGVAEQ